MLKKIAILILIISIPFIQGCPNCQVPVITRDYNSDIIFTGKALNSSKPGIFAVKADGTGLEQIIPNAQMFSPVTTDSTLLYLTISSTGQPTVHLFDLKTGNNTVVIPANQYSNINYPVISQDGTCIAFFDSTNALVIKKADKSPTSITYKICPKTLPVFSPDGKFLAFFLGDSIKAALRIIIVRTDTDPPGIEYSHKELSFGVNGLEKEDILDWSQQSFIVYSKTTDKKIDSIGVWDLDDDTKSFSFSVRSSGAFNPFINHDANTIMFTDTSGNMLQTQFKNIDTVARSYKYLTNINPGEYIYYPEEKAGKDVSSVLFVKFYKNNNDDFSGQLNILTMDKFGQSSIMPVCNNVNRAFWR
jgi:hypothetical protein